MTAFSQLSLTPVYWQGRVQIGASIEIFDAGTTTRRTVYQDSGLTAPHPQPIIVGADGRIPAIFTSGIAYKARITTAAGVLISEIDGIPGDNAAVSGGGGGGSSDLISGDVLFAYMTGVRSNFVRANGRTIGSPTSGASERASADCQALFTHLWTVDTTLAVSGGRGANATADWTANKQITLPDFRGRAPRGLDDMGSSSAGRLAGATVIAGAVTQLGSSIGTATEALSAAQNGPHSHAGTTSTVGAHAHTGNTSFNGSHGHTGGTAGAGSHAHGASASASASSDVQGDHAHTGSTSANGLHNHTGGSTDFNGDHAHTYDRGNITTAYAGGGLNAMLSATATSTSVAGNHQHGVSLPNDGNHSHSFTTANAGAHAHNIFVSVGVSIAVDGFHAHSFVTDGAGDHSHSFVTDANGSHAHTFATDSSGSGAAHNNVGPSLLGTFYIRL